MQYSVEVRNARLAADETEVGASPLLRILTGPAPANTAAAETGTGLVEVTLPADWQAAPAGGAAAKAGTWQEDVTAGGKARYFRLYNSAGTICHIQGLVAEAFAAAAVVEVGDQIDNGAGQAYIVTTAGTMAGAAPTGTGTGITSNTAVLDYVGPTGIVVQNIDMAVDQPFEIVSFVRTAGGA